ARLFRLPAAGIEAQAPEPGAEHDRQRLAVSQRRAVGVQEAVEERQPDRDSGSAQHAAQHVAAIHRLPRDHFGPSPLELTWLDSVRASLDGASIAPIWGGLTR